MTSIVFALLPRRQHAPAAGNEGVPLVQRDGLDDADVAGRGGQAVQVAHVLAHVLLVDVDVAQLEKLVVSLRRHRSLSPWVCR